MSSRPLELLEVQAALLELDERRELSQAHSTTTSFFPPDAVRKHFDEQRLRRILLAVDPSVPFRLAGEIVRKSYLFVFLILLRLGQPLMIRNFMRKDTLSDSRLPFGQHTDFPTGVSFSEFDEKQQPFCALVLDGGDVEPSEKRILPVTSRTELAPGGSAIVYKISIHPDFNNMAEPEISDPHVYVAKTFLPDEAESFANERDAYKRIEEESGQPIESLLQCYGSYTHKDTHTLLLEYCNGGTLETCFAKPQPRREKEILAFWTGLLGLVKAVHRLNVVHGWHQDVNPNNILLHMLAGRASWAYIAKLGDLGRSYFANREDGTQELVGRDRFGTKDYGAPECYRIAEDKFERGTRRYISDTIDVFSLGCVLLEAAVWLTEGPGGVLRFRDDRRHEASKAQMEEGIACFHDGSELLDCVQDQLNSFQSRVSLVDPLTASVCRSLIRAMLHVQHGNRMKTKDLWPSARRILAAQRTPSQGGPAGDSSVPQNVDMPRSRTDPQVSSSRYLQRFQSTSSVDPDPKQNIALTESPRMIPIRDGPSHMKAPEDDKLFTLTDDEAVQRWRDGESISSRTKATTEHDDRSKLSRTNSVPARISDERGQPSRPRNDSRLDPAHKYHARKPLPHLETMTVAGLMDLPGLLSNSLPTKERQLRAKLMNRDHSFILDNSYTTGRHWIEVCSVFRLLVFMLQNADRDGIELSFTTSSNARQTNDIDQLYQHACKEPQKGTSDMEEALQKAVNKHTFRMERESNPRPLSIYILTDGRFGGNPEVVLLGLEQMLRDRRLPRTSLGVQFISFGSDEEGLGKMQLLDDMSDKGKFDLPLDIVDTVRSTGNVWKMLLGSTEKEFDEQEQRQEQS